MNGSRTPEQALRGKTAVVTGGSRGIGRDIALSLARGGSDVIVVSRHVDQAGKVAAEIEAMGRRALAAGIDVAVPEQVHALMTEIVPDFGGVDIYVNNAGITIVKRLLDTTPEEMDAILDTNLKGAMYCLSGAARRMVEQGRGGSIVVVTSINALWPLAKQAVYTCTKAALEALVRCLAADLAGAGIRVNSVAPGAVRTDMNRHLGPEAMERLRARIPLGRVGEPADIGGVVSFLASDAAGYITGATVVVDGGFMLRIS